MALLLNLGFFRIFRAVVTSCDVHDASTQELKASAAVHRSLQHLEATDLSFHRASGPRHLERGVDGVEVAACGSRPQYLMIFDGAKLFNDLGDQAFVSPINSGNARRKPARRGRDTFVPYRMWIEHGWPTGQPDRSPAEFLFRCDVPATPPYLINIKRL